MSHLVLFFHLDEKMPLTLKLIDTGSVPGDHQRAAELAKEPGRPTLPYLVYRNVPKNRKMLVKVFATLLYTLIQEL